MRANANKIKVYNDKAKRKAIAYVLCQPGAVTDVVTEFIHNLDFDYNEPTATLKVTIRVPNDR